MRVSRLSVIGVTALVASLLTPVAPALADGLPPVAAITSPSDGATVTNPLTVTATGSVDPSSSDAAFSLILSVDGVQDLAGATDCTVQPDPKNCSATFTVDPTAWKAASSHTLQVEFVTFTGGFVNSPVVTVNVPAPVATISTPASTLTGEQGIGVTGSTDPATADSPEKINLAWDGAPLASQNCPMPLAHTCSLNYLWDTTLLPDAAHNLTATMTTSSGVTADAPPVAVAVHNPPPAVQITSPPNNSTGSGVITVTATGTIPGGEKDHPESMQLYLHDTNHAVSGQRVACDPASSTCDGTFTWDSTGQTGTFSLIVGFHTTRGRTDADTIHVTLANPDPTVTITSPAAGDTVSGSDVQVHADGTIDPSQNDVAKRMDLFVSGSDQPVDSAACPAAKSCSVVLHWDASRVNGNRDLTVRFVTATTSVLTTASVKATTTPPTANISSPVNGAVVSGVVSVVTGGAAVASNDTPSTMQLLVDGAALSAAQPCKGTTSAPKACSLPYTWDTTGLTGQHTLQAKLLTSKGFTGLSPLTTVTVVSPVPSAAIVSPALNATLHRTATITVTGAVDPSQSDTPSSVQLAVDGTPLGSALPCTPATAGARTCSTTYTWNTIGLVGRHVLTATVTTARGRQGASTAFPVYVYGGTKMVLTAVKTQHYGKTAKVTGRVTALINRSAVGGVKVKVLLVPAAGHAKALYVRTNAQGYFSVSFKPTLNTTVTATLVPPAYWGTSHTFSKVKVAPRAVCTVGKTVQRNGLDSGTCVIPHLAIGTKLTLQYSFKGHWYTIGSGLSHSTTVPFSFRLAAPGNYLIRVVLGASKRFVASATPSLKVTVT